MDIKNNSWRQGFTFGCIGDRTGVNRLADSRMGDPCEGNDDGRAEMHLDFDDFFVTRILV